MANQSLQSLGQTLRSRIDDLHASIQRLKVQVDSNSSSCKQVNGILVTLTQHDGKITNNSTNIQNLKDSFRDSRQIVFQKIENMNQTMNMNVQYIADVQELVRGFSKQIGALNVKIAQNAGQINQCYMLVTQLQKKMQQTDQSFRSQSSTKTNNDDQINDKIQKFFKRLIIGVITCVGVGFAVFAAKQYWNDYVHTLAIQHIQEIHQQREHDHSQPTSEVSKDK